MAKHLMMFEQFSIGGRNNLAYIVGDAQTGEAAAIDVGFNPDRVVRRLAELDATLKYVPATHGHRDHIGGAPQLKASTGARFAAFRAVAGVDEPLDDGAELHVGGVCIRVIHCPGHSPDSICLLADGRKLFTGDTLFAAKVPMRSLTKAEASQLNTSLGRLMRLGDEVEIWPGHAVGGRAGSTIGEERHSNPFLGQPSFDAFYSRRR